MIELHADGEVEPVGLERLAARFSASGLVAKPLPFDSSPFEWTLYWHRRYDKSAPHVWLRKLMQETCSQL